MRRVRALFYRMAGLFQKKTRDLELLAEMESHLQLHIEDNLRAGMSPAQARREAIMKLGGVEQTKENYRDRRGLPFLETYLQDMRYAFRMLRKNSGFTFVVMFTLALGIGANTTIFSMVNTLLLHPYSFNNLDGLVRVWENRGIDESFDARWIAPADAADYFSTTDSFEKITIYRDHSFNLAKDGSVEPALGCEVSASFFDVLGVSPAMGRGFVQGEEQPGSGQVAVLGDGLWRQRFGGDPEVLGKTIRLNGRDYTVVGVMPPKFSFPVPSQLWIPLTLTPEEKSQRSALSATALARLKPGVSVTNAEAALTVASRRLSEKFPETNGGRKPMVLQLRKELYLYTLPLFVLLQASAVFVLLLACANLANLMFARLIGRQKEIAMRTALGADRRRLTQLFLAETMLLSVFSGSAAAAVSFGSARLLRVSISEEWTKWVPGWSEIRVDPGVLLFTLALSALLGLIFGLAIVLRSGRVNLNMTLKEAGPGSMTRGKARFRSALVVSQVIFALVLLVCAGLMIQGFLHLSDIYAGLDPAKILRVETALPENSYSSEAKIANFYQQFLHSAASLQGVSYVSISTNQPASNVDNEMTFLTIEGRPAPRSNEIPSAELQTISPGYFSVLQVPLIAGRLFAETDTSVVSQVAIVSRSMSERFWPNENALGKRIKLATADSKSPWITVVGVVADVRQNWWSPPAQPTVYRPFLQSPRRSMTFLLRASNNPANYVSALGEAVRNIDPDVALRGISTLQTEVADSIGIIRVMGILMGIFGVAALTLSTFGVYGVLSENVAQRTREIGIRIALGASSLEVSKLVIGHAFKLAVIGELLALPISLAVGRLMASLVYGIVALNFALLASFAAVLLVAALFAAYIPARRAMRVDPTVALRYE